MPYPTASSTMRKGSKCCQSSSTQCSNRRTRLKESAPSTVKCNRQVKRPLGKPRLGFGSRVSCGRGLSSTLWTSAFDNVEKSVPFGKYCRKVGFGTQCGDDFGVGGELFSVVVSDRFDAIGERQKDASARPHDGICTLVRELGELGVFGLAVDVRHDDAFVTLPDNRVGFPVADAAFLGDNGGALVDVHAVRNQATTCGFALTLVVLFTAVTQLD